MSREDVCIRCGSTELRPVTRFGRPMGREVQCQDCKRRFEPARAEPPQGETCLVCTRLGPMACSVHLDTPHVWPAAQPETGDDGRALAEEFLAQHEKRLDDFCSSASRGEYGAGHIDYVLTDLVTDAVKYAIAARRGSGA
jgi:hypothetical protein